MSSFSGLDMILFQALHFNFEFQKYETSAVNLNMYIKKLIVDIPTARNHSNTTKYNSKTIENPNSRLTRFLNTSDKT